ncbi:MAG: flotillin family protein, partial [Boseongicola sp. SB0667_bin_21]|nr:flotillin family protein [Boseongicola sp. SB0667_bin_21]
LDDARIAHQKKRRQLEIERERAVEEAAMEKAIALYGKSLDESAAAIEADAARARAAEAAAKVDTAAALEEASREKQVGVADAEKEAERAKLAAHAEEVVSAVRAEAQRLINEAENILTDEARASLFKRNMLERLEGIIAAQVKPLEKIDEIKIMQLGGGGTTGLNWADGGSDGGGGGGGAPSPTDEVINSALRYRVQGPMIDSLMNDIGIDGSNLARSAIFQDASNMARAMSESQKVRAATKAEEEERKSKDGEAKS